MGNKSEQKKQKEELPTGVGSEDRIEAKIDRRPAGFFPGERPAPGWVLGVKRPSAEKEEKEEKDDSSSSAATGDTGEG